MKKPVFFTLVTCLIMIAAGPACGKKEGDEPTKYASQEGLARLTTQAQSQSSSKNISVNPAFLAAADKRPATTEAKDLDRIIRPILIKHLNGAKLTEESRAAETKTDGEVVENKLTYAVKDHLTVENGKTLHAAFRAAGFSSSPRLGSKPTTLRDRVLMSLFETTPLRTYSLVIDIDLKKQRIVVESYRLGSKYDRLM